MPSSWMLTNIGADGLLLALALAFITAWLLTRLLIRYFGRRGVYLPEHHQDHVRAVCRPCAHGSITSVAAESLRPSEAVGRTGDTGRCGKASHPRRGLAFSHRLRPRRRRQHGADPSLRPPARSASLRRPRLRAHKSCGASLAQKTMRRQRVIVDSAVFAPAPPGDIFAAYRRPFFLANTTRYCLRKKVSALFCENAAGIHVIYGS